MQPEFMHSFIEQFLKLSEQEQFAAGKLFREKTGGTLSPYSNPLPVVVGLVPFATEQGERLLAVQRGIAPFIGHLAFPGGFQELGESAQTAVSREIMEEVGLQTNPSLFTIFGNPMMAHNGNQILFFRYTQTLPQEAVSHFTPNSETQQIHFVDPTHSLCFPTHQEKLQDFFEQMAPTQKRSPRF